MTTINESYILVADTEAEHDANKVFMDSRYPVGNDAGYERVIDDSNRRITLTRTYFDWVIPVTQQ